MSSRAFGDDKGLLSETVELIEEPSSQASALGWRSKFVAAVEGHTVERPDDLLARLFTGAEALPQDRFVNTRLVDELLLTYLWYAAYNTRRWVKLESVVKVPATESFVETGRIARRAQHERLSSPGVAALLQGATHAAFRDWSQAAHSFARAAVPEGSFHSTFYNGAHTYRDPYRMTNLGRGIKIPEDYLKVEGQLGERLNSSPTPALVFSADRGYFLRFAREAVQSAYASGFNTDTIIFLLLRPGETVSEAELSGEMGAVTDAAAPGAQVMIVPCRTDQEFRPMSATARFFGAALVHALNPRPLMILDIDFRFNSEMKSMFDDVVERNALAFTFNSHGPALFPWARVSAMATFVPSGPAAETFFRAYCSYAIAAMKPERNWWIDQNALHAAFLRVRDAYPLLPFGNIHPFASAGARGNVAEDILNFKRNKASAATSH